MFQAVGINLSLEDEKEKWRTVLFGAAAAFLLGLR